MASQDYTDLMIKLHTEGYKIISINRNAKRVGNSFSIIATVVLEKDKERINFRSSEADLIIYLAELRGVVDTNGEYEFKHLKNIKQYDADLEYLADLDRSRIEKATKEIMSGRFSFSYRPQELVDELLGNKRNIKKHLLPLKKEYHHILAAFVLQSKKMLKAQELLIKKYPEAQKVVDGIGQILMAFRSTGNAVKDYKFYKGFVSFNIDDLGKRMSAQLPAADDTVKDFVRRSKINADIVIPKMMNIYGRFLELITPILNLIRIGLELKRGNASPEARYTIGKNIKILKSDPNYGTLFGCLDKQIRHSDAHASIYIDKEARKVQLIDARSGKERIVGTYTFEALIDMINTMQNEFFPVIYPTLVLFDIAMFELLLISREYKYLLLAISNI